MSINGSCSPTATDISTVPPAYSTPSPLTPAEILDIALEDLKTQTDPCDSPFYVPLEQRRNPDAKTLHQRLTVNWEGLPTYSHGDKASEAITWPRRMIDAFFTAIAQGSIPLTVRFLESHLLDANTPKQEPDAGLTPLMCAIQHNRTLVVSLLISHGASVYDYGICRPFSIENSSMRDSEDTKHWISEAAVRSPIQLAAQIGHLQLVKKFCEEFSSADAMIAPDGQTALRLASQNGHANIVSYLPARRGGGYLRWKTKHHKFMKKMHKSVDVLTEIATITFYKIPRWFLKSLGSCTKEAAIYLWENKHKFPKWCWNVLREIWDLILQTPQDFRKLMVGLWRFAIDLITKKIPRAANIVWKFSTTACRKVGNAVFWVINRTVSFLHTVVTAIVTALKSLTWADVRAGFVDLLKALFVSFPKALYHVLKTSVIASGKTLIVIFGGTAKVLWWLVQLIFKAMKFLGMHVLKIVNAVTGTAFEAGKELYVWVNPKA